jgi:hypothetical protein
MWLLWGTPEKSNDRHRRETCRGTPVANNDDRNDRKGCAMRTIRTIIFIWALAALIGFLFGDVSVAGGSGMTTANFLNIGVGARAVGMGGAFTAVADNPSAVYWNPAGLRSGDNRQIEFSHTAWAQDITVDNLYAVIPGKKFSFGVGMTYLGYGQIQSYDEAGNRGEDLSMYSLAATVSASTDLTEHVAAGVSAKFVQESFDIVKGTAFAGDIGFLAGFGDLQVGLAAVNLGSKITFVSESEALPSGLRVGLAYRHFDGKALFSLEGHVPFKGEVSVHQGLEVAILDQFHARSGITYETDNTPGADALGYNLGFGLAYGVGQFDYTFTPSDDFGRDALHHFSITISW